MWMSTMGCLDHPLYRVSFRQVFGWRLISQSDSMERWPWSILSIAHRSNLFSSHIPKWRVAETGFLKPCDSALACGLGCPSERKHTESETYLTVWGEFHFSSVVSFLFLSFVPFPTCLFCIFVTLACIHLLINAPQTSPVKDLPNHDARRASFTI